MPKPIVFLGSSLDVLRGFPEAARREAGFQLHKVQHGEDPDDWKPMPTVGSGVCEIRIRDGSGIYRVFYLARLAQAVYVLHAFQKKSQKTPQKDIEIAHTRYRELMRPRP
jgi:phage-related protein